MEYHCIVTYNRYYSGLNFSFESDNVMFAQYVYQNKYSATNTNNLTFQYGVSILLIGSEIENPLYPTILPMSLIVAQSSQNLFYNYDGVFHEIKANNFEPSRFEFTCNDNFDSKAAPKLTSNRLN